MAIPAKATGYGNNSTAANVFQITFTQALSSAPRYEAYDGAVFPATGSATTVTNGIFTAGSGTSTSMLSLVDTSTAGPSSNWKPVNGSAGSANPNRMKGTSYYVTSTVTPGAGGTIKWNEVLEVPSTATTSTTMAHDLLVRYTYTGTAPSLTWAFNEGTEGSPTWTTMVPGTNGLRHCRTGTVSGGPYLADIPAAGTQDTTEGWVTT
jgi:hypothetical protein